MPLIQQIREAEAQVPVLEGRARQTKEDAEADGTITPEEQADIDRVEGKLADLRSLLRNLTEQWEANKQAYSEFRNRLSDGLAEASACQYAVMEGLQSRIIAAQDATDAKAGEEDYATALAQGEVLEGLVGEFHTQMAELEIKRADYEERLASIQPKLEEYSQSLPTHGYVDQQMGEMVTIQGEMETAAEAGDFEAALGHLDRLAAKVDEIDAAIIAKEEEYRTARGTLDDRLNEISQDAYFDIMAERDALGSSTDAIDTAAEAEDWQGALTLTEQALVDCESYSALVQEQENTKSTIESRIEPMRSGIDAHSGSTSSVKSGAEANLATIEAALRGEGSLNQALQLTDTVMTQISEMDTLKSVNDRLAAADPDDLDDVSRQIVEEMKAAGTLNTLPTEARTDLVNNMMQGTPTADEHAAIQEIFSMPHIDRQFEAIDEERRQSIIDAYMSDPEVQRMAEEWDGMDADERMAAVRKLIEVPCGDEGWDVGMPDRIEPITDGWTDGTITLGAYTHETGNPPQSLMTFNVGADAMNPDDFGFADALDTVTHEIGHRYQMQLIERLNPSHPDPLEPGDPEYEQARWLQQDDNYLNNHNAQFDNIYWTSPSETHSRVMGSEMQAGLREGFDLPEAEGGHDHHGHGHTH